MLLLNLSQQALTSHYNGAEPDPALLESDQSEQRRGRPANQRGSSLHRALRRADTICPIVTVYHVGLGDTPSIIGVKYSG